MFALHTCKEDSGSLVGTSGLSLIIVGFVRVAIWTEGGRYWELFHLLILFQDLEFLIMGVCDDVFELPRQVIVIATDFTY
jgi:hypothetical protein